MAYIGHSASGNFTTKPSKDTFSGDGSTTAFTLSEGATTNTVDVFVENVRQEPTTAYTVDGTTLTFTAAPGSGTNNIYVVNRGPLQLSATHPAAQALEASTGTFTGSLSGVSATFTGDLTVDTNTLHVDSTNNAIGILTTSPSNASLDIGGRLRVLQDAAATTGAVIIRESSGGVGGHLQFVTNDNSGQRGFIASNSSGDILFGSSAERLRMLSAGGLTFNGDTAAANALDDYEEGTWTPTYIGSTTNPTVTYDIQLGRYTKIGDYVSFWLRIRTDSFSGGSGGLQIDGLPFTSDSTTHFFGSIALGFTGGWVNSPSSGLINTGATRISLRKRFSTSVYSTFNTVMAMSDAETGANDNDVILTGFYKV